VLTIEACRYGHAVFQRLTDSSIHGVNILTISEGLGAPWCVKIIDADAFSDDLLFRMACWCYSESVLSNGQRFASANPAANPSPRKTKLTECWQ
jgi:hypothetical protein